MSEQRDRSQIAGTGAEFEDSPDPEAEEGEGQQAMVEASRYIGQMQRAMADLARSADLRFLAFLCDVAAREAGSILLRLETADRGRTPPTGD